MKSICDNFIASRKPLSAAHETTPTAKGAPLFRVRRVRIGGLDVLRGLCVLLMVLDHAAFDLMEIPSMAVNFISVPESAFSRLCYWASDYWDATWRIALRLPVIALFFCISGICTSFSKNNILRGVKLALASCALSFATIALDDFLDMGLSIVFGVLHCFTVSVFLYVLLDLLLKDKAKYACLGLGLLFMVWGMTFDFYNVPAFNSLAKSELDFASVLQLMAGTAYYGGDCFGILPYAGFFLVGVYGGKALYGARSAPYLPLFNTAPFAPVRWVGRNALWAYLLHQPIVLGVIALIAVSHGYKFF